MSKSIELVTFKDGTLEDAIELAYWRYVGLFKGHALAERDAFKTTLRRLLHERGFVEYSEPAPIPMRLTCPDCKTLHIDEGEFATKPHHTHSCQHCGLTWRPAVVNTVGVRFLPGFKNGVRTYERNGYGDDCLTCGKPLLKHYGLGEHGLPAYRCDPAETILGEGCKP